MCRNEALEAAIDECEKAGVGYHIKRKKNHHQLLINGTVRTDVRRTIRGN